MWTKMRGDRANTNCKHNIEILVSPLENLGQIGAIIAFNFNIGV